MKKPVSKLPSVYEYGPGCRSPQAVPWMEGDGVAYLKAAHQRALRVKAMRESWSSQETTVRDQAGYNGGSTYILEKGKLPKV